MHCAIIGSGIAGIASAVRLQLKGHRVEVFEANAVPGGKIREHRANGFRFDMGPSVFTMPHLVNELFELAGKSAFDYFQFTKLDPSFRFFYEDGTQLNWTSNLDKLIQELESKTGESDKAIEKFARESAEKFNITKEVFMENSLHVLRNYFSKPFLSGTARLHKVGVHRSMNSNHSRIFKDPKIIQLFNHFALYVGSNPLVAPSTLNIIAHIMLEQGTFLPEKGMFSLVNALVKLAGEIGVRFHFQAPVEEIVVKDKKVDGIKIKNEFLAFDRVISNMDIYYTYHRLLPDQKKPTLILNQPKSSSVIGFLWGVSGQHPDLQVHNMLFAKDRDAEYHSVFDHGIMSKDPTTYICITSKHNPNDAPEGKENWFVHATAPNMSGQDWDTLVNETRQNLFSKIERMLACSERAQAWCSFSPEPE